MAGWKLEVCKMAMYIMFPVGLFYLFNQPAYFEEWVTKTKRELYPPESLGHHKELQQAIRDFREQHEAKMMKALENKEK